MMTSSDVLTKQQVESNLKSWGFDVVAAINELKLRKNASIVAHYYQEPEVQEIADFIGDSLDLSRKVSAMKSDIIVFCGVKFMAEVANALNPSSKVFIPDIEAGCSLEQSCPGDKFKRFIDAHPGHVVVSYINCSAEVKALSDIICTSSNAVAVVNSIPLEKPIIFAPDKYLGAYVQKQTGRKMLLWNGSCIVHERFSEVELVKMKARYSGSYVLAHPECPENILKHADFVGSTSALLGKVKSRVAKSFIILTEPGIIHQMKKVNPEADFYDVPQTAASGGACEMCNNCPFMKLNTLEKVYEVLAMEDPKRRVELSETIRFGAMRSLSRMLEVA